MLNFKEILNNDELVDFLTGNGLFFIRDIDFVEAHNVSATWHIISKSSIDRRILEGFLVKFWPAMSEILLRNDKPLSLWLFTQNLFYYVQNSEILGYQVVLPSEIISTYFKLIFDNIYPLSEDKRAYLYYGYTNKNALLGAIIREIKELSKLLSNDSSDQFNEFLLKVNRA